MYTTFGVELYCPYVLFLVYFMQVAVHISRVMFRWANVILTRLITLSEHQIRWAETYQAEL